MICMAIPVKLWRRSSLSGEPLAATAIHLDATEFRISVERSISAFTVPFNNAYKIGMDLNLPITVLNITGVLVDDEAVGETGADAVATMSTIGYYPKQNSEDSAVLKDIRSRHLPITIDNKGGYPIGATSIKVAGPVLNAHHKVQLTDIFTPGKKIYVAGDMPGVNGQLVTHTTITGTSNLTNTLTLGGTGLVSPLSNNTRLSDISPDLFLHHQGFSLVPGLWCRGISSSSSGSGTFGLGGNTLKQIMPNTPIVYRFDGNTLSQYATGGSGAPTFVAGTEPENGGFPTINIPIGGLYTSTSAGNPAKALMQSIKDGIDCSANVTTLSTSLDGGRTSASAFDTVMSSDGYSISIMRVDEGRSSRDMFNPNGFSPKGGGTGGSSSGYYQSSGYDSHTDITRQRTSLLHSNFSREVPVRGALSAGDKAQDLLGIFSNSPIGEETELLGIQVPYDSLIQSDTTSPEVRNFFLTYGSGLNEKRKTSDGNTWLASTPMKHDKREVDASESILGVIGTYLSDDDGNIFSQTADLIDGVFAGAVDLVKNIAIILDKKVMENTGGITIIPARLNIRYDAGERHYTYDMLLSAVNHKIAP